MSKIAGMVTADVTLSYWQTLGTTVEEPNASPVTVTIPGGATIFQIRPRGGACYFDVGAVIGDGLGVYLPENAAELWGPLSNLGDGLNIFAAAGVFVHIAFFREVPPLTSNN